MKITQTFKALDPIATITKNTYVLSVKATCLPGVIL